MVTSLEAHLETWKHKRKEEQASGKKTVQPRVQNNSRRGQAAHLRGDTPTQEQGQLWADQGPVH